MKTNENKVIISGLVPRGDQWYNKAMDVNKFLKQLCVSQDFYFIDNTNISYHFFIISFKEGGPSAEAVFQGALR